MTGASGHALRAAVVETVRELERRGLNHNTAGNVSVRHGANLLVTPSGIAGDRLAASDVVELSSLGEPLPGQRVPTSEWRLHVAIYAARPEASAIVHTHSVEATAAACVGLSLPALHYVVAKVGGSSVPCAPYATYGSTELAEHVVSTLGATGMACLMANHGMVALGADLGAALALAHDVEWLAALHRRARQLGAPIVLPPEEIERVALQFRTYGQP